VRNAAVLQKKQNLVRAELAVAARDAHRLVHGADQVLFFLQYGGIPHDRIMKSIELIGRHALGEIHSWKTPGGITSAQPEVDLSNIDGSL